MRLSRHSALCLVLAVFALVALAGCVTVFIPTPGHSKGGDKGGGTKAVLPGNKELPFPAVSNNSTIRLEAADYVGDVTIRANKVTIVGRGPGATRIRGRLTVTGNNCTITGLTIAGSVMIRGNNADLRGARIEGKVSSTGKNNTW